MADQRVHTIVEGAREEIERAATRRDLDEVRVKYLGKRGTLTQLLRALPGLPPAERPIVGREANEAKAGLESELEARRGCPGGRRAAGPAGGRPARPDAPGPPRRPGRPPPAHPGARRDRRRVHGHGLRRRRGARGRARLLQLRGPQHPQGPSRPRHAGHVLRGRRDPPPDPHLPGPDPDHGAAEAAGADHLPGTRVPPGRRHHALARVPPGRGAGGRPRHLDGRPQGHARAVRPRAVRPGQPDPLPAVLLPVHRAVGRGGRPLLPLQGRRLPGVQGSRAGSRSWAPAWSTRGSSRRWATTRRK